MIFPNIIGRQLVISMGTIPVKDLEAGMVLCEDVFSNKKQRLARRGTTVTPQLIEHFKYYEIASVSVYATPQEEAGFFASEAKNAQDSPRVETYSQRVRRSPAFRRFRTHYSEKVNFLENNLNQFIKKDKDLDVPGLLNETLSLFGKNSTTISMFDMLHNMRQIDDSTYAHSLNVSIISRLIGKWLDFPEDDLNILTIGGLLHDIGKAEISNDILGKPGKLTDEEYREIKRHPLIGYQLLLPLDLDWRIKNIALMHHERFDGTGYPYGLKDSSIDTFASIVSIADVYDAMTSNRCYRDGLCPFEVIAMFESEGLTQFNPKYILTFLEHIANAYVNNEVRLNDGSTGRIVLNQRHLTRPMIQLDSGDFVNLESRHDLYVQAII